MTKLRVLDLFSGIGGFSLGLERAQLKGAEYDGFQTTAFCEIEEFPRKVLAKHWPSVPCYEDVRDLTAERLAADGIAVDVITGGFPCQDISVAGKQAGIGEGTRSGLWSECLRLVGELRPRYAIFENVANLLRGPSEQPGGWFSTILADLASVRYHAEWENIPACALGAPHRRERVWLVAYPHEMRDRRIGGTLVGSGRDARSQGRQSAFQAECGGEDVADAAGERQSRSWQSIFALCAAESQNWQAIDAIAGGIGDVWRTEPSVGRVANGIPDRAHRIAGLGNAVVPQIPELIGNAILAAINPCAPSSLRRAGESVSPDALPEQENTK